MSKFLSGHWWRSVATDPGSLIRAVKKQQELEHEPADAMAREDVASGKTIPLSSIDSQPPMGEVPVQTFMGQAVWQQAGIGGQMPAPLETRADPKTTSRVSCFDTGLSSTSSESASRERRKVKPSLTISSLLQRVVHEPEGRPSTGVLGQACEDYGTSTWSQAHLRQPSTQKIQRVRAFQDDIPPSQHGACASHHAKYASKRDEWTGARKRGHSTQAPRQRPALDQRELNSLLSSSAPLPSARPR
jgi:hypothetical protein